MDHAISFKKPSSFFLTLIASSRAGVVMVEAASSKGVGDGANSGVQESNKNDVKRWGWDFSREEQKSWKEPIPFPESNSMNLPTLKRKEKRIDGIDKTVTAGMKKDEWLL